MAVIINLKEIFATDSQSVLSEKSNFNFNQLISLGIGQPGATGETGLTGSIGPIGSTGLTGPTGSLIYGVLPSVSITAPSPSIIPSAMVINDILITEDKILKKISSGTGWEQLTDFNDLVQAALGVNISPFVKITPTARIVKHKITSGLDLTNELVDSANPTYPTPGLQTNYQTILYNFNELKTNSLISNLVMQISSNITITKSFSALVTSVDLLNDTITITAHGFIDGDYVTYSNEGGTSVGGLIHFNNYYIKKSSVDIVQLCETSDLNPIDLTSYGNSGTFHKLIKAPTAPDKIFPATSNLSLYSYFDAIATQAKEFAPSTKGYRNQIELGSIDSMETAYSGSITTPSYLISPSFENLRIRKYRLEFTNPSLINEANPGRYFLRSEYDLSSAGHTGITNFSPRRNSEQVWKINKATTSQELGTSIEMKLTNSNILDETDGASSVRVDGLYLTRTASYDSTVIQAYFGIGFDPIVDDIIRLEASTGVEFEFRNTPVRLYDPFGGYSATLSNTGIIISAGDYKIESYSGDLIKLNEAVVIKNDRLAQGLPFPTTQVPSSDSNTLDDYEEGTWTPVVYGNYFIESEFKKLVVDTIGHGVVPIASTLSANLTSTYSEYQNIYSGSTDDESPRIIPIIIHFAKYIKIGKLVKCWVNFSINPNFNYIFENYSGIWPAITTVPSITLPGAIDLDRFDALYDNDTYFMKNRAIGLTLPFAPILPTGYPSSGSYYNVVGMQNPTTQFDDVLSQTAVSGLFHKVIDVRNDTIDVDPTIPILVKPAMYAKPGKFIDGVPSYSSIDMTSAFAENTSIQPITGTGRQLLKLGLVQTQYVSLLDTYFHAPAVLFYADRDITDVGNYANAPASTNTLATTQLSPVTAFDCLYAATVPDATLANPNGVITKAAIRYSCEFSYESLT